VKARAIGDPVILDTEEMKKMIVQFGSFYGQKASKEELED
jgi:L-fuculose-phosphate aldolase